jgi:hypothetical protein
MPHSGSANLFAVPDLPKVLICALTMKEVKMATRAAPIPTAKATDLVQLLISDKNWKLPADKCLEADGTWYEGSKTGSGQQEVKGKRKYKVRPETCSEAEKVVLIMAISGDKKAADALNKRIQEIAGQLGEGGSVRGKPAVKIGETRTFSINAKNGTVVIPLKVFFPAGTKDGDFDGKVSASYNENSVLITAPVPK